MSSYLHRQGNRKDSWFKIPGRTSRSMHDPNCLSIASFSSTLHGILVQPKNNIQHQFVKKTIFSKVRHKISPPFLHLFSLYNTGLNEKTKLNTSWYFLSVLSAFCRYLWTFTFSIIIVIITVARTVTNCNINIRRHLTLYCPRGLQEPPYIFPK